MHDALLSPAAILATLLAASVLATPARADRAAAQERLRHREGVLVTASENGELVHVGDAARARRRFSPCSTFKLPHAAIALETGVLDPDDSAHAWDPKRHPRQDHWPRSWARDQDLPSALRNSVLWYFQDVAPRVGRAEMKRRLDAFEYGNRDVSGPIDSFWLESSLKISPNEQVAFLQRLHGGELGLSPRTLSFLESALVLEKTAGHVLVGKTGTCRKKGGGYAGWLVGWARTRDATHYYALHLESDDFGGLYRERVPLVTDVLRDLGRIPGAEQEPALD